MTKHDEAMVERVARAICIADGALPDFIALPIFPGPGEGPEPVWRKYIAQARAAINAISPLERAGGEVVAAIAAGLKGASLVVAHSDEGDDEEWLQNAKFIAGLLPATPPPPLPETKEPQPAGHVEIAHDGFAGDIIGYYETREGKRGVVVQQDGTRVVHVYGVKWITPDAAAIRARRQS